MSRKRFDNFNCSIAASLNQVGDWWTLLIVREALFGVHSFSGFQKNLGIAKNILTNRLEKMVENDVFEKHVSVDDSRRFDYTLTEKGRDLFSVLVALMQWGDEWGGGKPPVLLIDRMTGQDIDKITVSSPSATDLHMRDVSILPGPGATAEVRERFKGRS